MPDAPSLQTPPADARSRAVAIHLDKPSLRAILAYVSKDPARINLRSILVDRGQLVATDGHTLVRADTRRPGDDPQGRVLIPAEAAKAAYRAASAKSEIVITSDDGRRYQVTVDGQPAHSGRAPDTTFPPYRQVIPTIAEGSDAACIRGLDPEYMARVALAGKASGTSNWRWAMGEALDPIVASCEVWGDAPVHVWEIVIMPCRL